MEEKKKSRDSVVPGTVGALLGSMLGALCIVLEGRTAGGFSLICGVVMAVCTLQGYALLGGRLSRRGVVISLGIMAVAIYFANQVNCTIEIMVSAPMIKCKKTPRKKCNFMAERREKR